jgi:hypothetical protein
MTDWEWLECKDPMPMLAIVRENASVRKSGLLVCAFCRRIQHVCCPDTTTQMIGLLEQMAEGISDGRDLDRYVDLLIEAGSEIRQVQTDGQYALHHLYATLDITIGLIEKRRNLSSEPLETLEKLVSETAGAALHYLGVAWEDHEGHADALAAEHGEQVTFIRCLCSPLFRTVTLNPAWLTWNGSTVPKISQGIHDEQAFDRMPILADALQDAGCTEQTILDHCRQPGEHVRGCWVVDLILSKE